MAEYQDLLKELIIQRVRLLEKREASIVKPPLGLIPKNVHRSQRIAEIRSALERYQEDGWVPPAVWREELAELLKEIPDD